MAPTNIKELVMIAYIRKFCSNSKKQGIKKLNIEANRQLIDIMKYT